MLQLGCVSVLAVALMASSGHTLRAGQETVLGSAASADIREFCEVIDRIAAHDGAEVTIRADIVLSYEHGMTIMSDSCKTSFALRGHEWHRGLSIDYAQSGDPKLDRSVKEFDDALSEVRKVLGKFTLASPVVVRGRIDLGPLRRAVPGQNLDLGPYPGRLILYSIRGHFTGPLK